MDVKLRWNNTNNSASQGTRQSFSTCFSKDLTHYFRDVNDNYFNDRHIFFSQLKEHEN